MLPAIDLEAVDKLKGKRKHVSGLEVAVFLVDGNDRSCHKLLSQERGEDLCYQHKKRQVCLMLSALANDFGLQKCWVSPQ